MARELRTPLCEALGIQFPILSVGFGAGARAELVSAVSNSGGYGVLGASGVAPDDLRAEIERTRTLTDRPFGFNVIIDEDPSGNVEETGCDSRPAASGGGCGGNCCCPLLGRPRPVRRGSARARSQGADPGRIRRGSRSGCGGRRRRGDRTGCGGGRSRARYDVDLGAAAGLGRRRFAPSGAGVGRNR